MQLMHPTEMPFAVWMRLKGETKFTSANFFKKKPFSKNSFITERQKAATTSSTFNTDILTLGLESKIDGRQDIPGPTAIWRSIHWERRGRQIYPMYMLGIGRTILVDNTFDIDSATLSLLQFVVTPEDAEEIVKKRPFESIDDAVNKTQIPERCLCETQNL